MIPSNLGYLPASVEFIGLIRGKKVPQNGSDNPRFKCPFLTF